MRSGSRALLGLTLLAGFSAAGFVRAEEATPTCDVPAYLLTSECLILVRLHRIRRDDRARGPLPDDSRLSHRDG